MQNQLVPKQVNLEGHTVAYWEGGQLSNSTPLLFLHGWGLSAEAYRDSLNALSREYRVIAPDLPGFGKSSNPKYVWDAHDYAKFTVAFAQQLNIQDVHVVGHSFGGGIGLAVAALEQSFVRSTIGLNTVGIPARYIPEVLLQKFIEVPAQAWETSFSPQNLHLFQAFLENCAFHPQTIQETLIPVLKQDLRHIFPKIASPCLIVWGRNDRIIPLASGREISQRIGGSQLIVLERASHDWSLLLPDKLAEIVFDFIGKVEQQQNSF